MVTKGAVFIDSVLFFFCCGEATFLDKITGGMQDNHCLSTHMCMKDSIEMSVFIETSHNSHID
jgi:hypothetical protein